MVYDKKTAILIGGVYRDLQKFLNGGKHHIYQNSEIFPIKYLTLLVKKATPLHIPEDLDKRISEVMDMISPDELDKLMNEPSPMEFRTWYLWEKGRILLK